MRNDFKKLQKTLKDSVSFSGAGLHSGSKCNVTLRPNDADTGISFVRKDLKTSNIIQATYDNIHKSNLCTTLKPYNSNATVYTVEHLLAAIKGNDIDNLIIELDSPEVPILDGSSKEYDKIIKGVGTIEQKNKYKKFLIINNELEVRNKNSIFSIKPSDTLEIKCVINFPNPIGKQKVSLGNNLVDIYDKVKECKTFCFFEDIETMKNNDLAKGGTLDNAVVIKDNKIINTDFENEENYFVKHKTLDIIGDLSLIGLNIIGSISVYYPGHELNRLAMQKIFSSFSNYRIFQYNKNVEYISENNILTI